MSGAGRLFGVGVGPGDPELVTVKAQRVIEAADVVAYPVARGKQGVADEDEQRVRSLDALERLGEAHLRALRGRAGDAVDDDLAVRARAEAVAAGDQGRAQLDVVEHLAVADDPDRAPRRTPIQPRLR